MEKRKFSDQNLIKLLERRNYSLNLDDIIEYDEESTNLDFKKEEYKKADYTSLIKDVMSMANALNTETKRIIIGAKHKPGEEKEICGLEILSDQATFENIVQENIEPNISFNYYPYKYKNKKLGIIEIFDNYDKPYMMKKDYGKLKKGDMWIRKGSRQSKVTREDLDRMFEIRKKANFEDKVIIGFEKDLKSDICITKNNIKKENFPSSVRKKELEDLVDKLEKKYNESSAKENKTKLSISAQLASMYSNMFGEFRDSDKSVRVGYDRLTNMPIYKTKEGLLKSIKNVSHDYYDDDCYYFFEKNSNKINFFIYNDGTEFLENVRIEFYFDSNVFIIAEDICEKPKIENPLIISQRAPKNYRYPNVYEDEGYIVVKEEHDQIRHKTLTEVFYEDLRVLVKPDVEIKKMKVRYKIGAKNLANHVEGTININIV